MYSCRGGPSGPGRRRGHAYPENAVGSLSFVGPRAHLQYSKVSPSNGHRPPAEPLTGVETLGVSALTLRHGLLSLDISDLLLLEVGSSPQWLPGLDVVSSVVFLSICPDLLPCGWGVPRKRRCAGWQAVCRGCSWLQGQSQRLPRCSGVHGSAYGSFRACATLSAFHRVSSSSRALQGGIKAHRCQQTGQAALRAGLLPGTDLNPILTITVPVRP